jgi:predicted secreted hydrolase
MDDRTELMLFQLRRKDGSVDPWSSGTYVDAKGKARNLRREEFSLEPVAWWTSGKSGGRYPIRWRIRVPGLGVALECSALLPDQELAVRPVYWEGAVSYSGSAKGVGYLEMTGYAAPVKLE